MAAHGTVANEPYIVVCDVDAEFCSLAERHFTELLNCVEVIHTRLENLCNLHPVDAVVWPCNVQALPASGLDRALSCWLGLEILDRARQRILAEYGDDGAPIGTSFVLHRAERRCPFIIFAVVFPRVRDGPSRAMHSVLETVCRHNEGVTADRQRTVGDGSEAPPIQSLGCPGLGAFTGSPDLDDVAAQMARALRDFRCEHGMNAACLPGKLSSSSHDPFPNDSGFDKG
mmetsp:Transcript_877/g.2475  ORF Transcript_877/g.2475 Transcript_877/m.2475 type:complete len:229 (-) Transcript_877:13-699(-)